MVDSRLAPPVSASGLFLASVEFTSGGASLANVIRSPNAKALARSNLTNNSLLLGPTMYKLAASLLLLAAAASAEPTNIKKDFSYQVQLDGEPLDLEWPEMPETPAVEFDMSRFKLPELPRIELPRIDIPEFSVEGAGFREALTTFKGTALATFGGALGLAAFVFVAYFFLVLLWNLAVLIFSGKYNLLVGVINWLGLFKNNVYSGLSGMKSRGAAAPVEEVVDNMVDEEIRSRRNAGFPTESQLLDLLSGVAEAITKYD